jgi:2,4-didehydro-3-deoxy-L-rhamnonate hydrolase
MSLQSGDVILTGTPAGVGMGRKPPRYLVIGDVVTAACAGLGEQSHRVTALA